MKKYTTKPIDFTGCHPVIAEALKRGKAVECFVYDSPSCEYKRCWVLAYYVDNNYPYRTGEEAYRYAEPIPLDDYCVGDWSWPPCIIEEVEDDE